MSICMKYCVYRRCEAIICALSQGYETYMEQTYKHVFLVSFRDKKYSARHFVEKNLFYLGVDITL